MRQTLSKWYRAFLRIPMNRANRHRLRNQDVTILSANCTGGVIYHELGLPFLSPTINLYMTASDFIRFLRDPQRYVAGNLQFLHADKGYPVARLDDIVIHGVYYTSFAELQDKWQKRAARIRWDNVYVMMLERDGCTYEDICAFDQLPYAHKVIFVHREMPEIQSAVYLPHSEEIEQGVHQVGDLTMYQGRYTGKRLIDEWDYVAFLNQ